MVGFFSLGRRGGGGIDTSTSSSNQEIDNSDQPNQIHPESWFLFSNNNKNKNKRNGQQDVDVVPAADSPCDSLERWQQHHQFCPSSGGGGAERSGGGEDKMMMMMSRSSGGGCKRGTMMMVNRISCEDCGNQAKKGCRYNRCRSCCNSQGFHCQTHVHSTCLSASASLRRQQQLQQEQQQQQPQPHRGGDKQHHHQHLPNSLSSPGLELGNNLPAEVSRAALFRCVRVSAVDDNSNHDQYAYQTAVNIGGHVFKGILYDQGPDDDTTTHHQSSAANATADSTIDHSQAATPFLDPCLYPSPFNSFSAGNPFFL